MYKVNQRSRCFEPCKSWSSANLRLIVGGHQVWKLKNRKDDICVFRKDPVYEVCTDLSSKCCKYHFLHRSQWDWSIDYQIIYYIKPLNYLATNQVLSLPYYIRIDWWGPRWPPQEGAHISIISIYHISYKLSYREHLALYLTVHTT